MHDLAGGQADTWHSGPTIEWLAKIARPPTPSQELGGPKLPSLGAIREDDEHARTPQASKAHQIPPMILVGVPTSAHLGYSHRKALQASYCVWELLPCSVQSSGHLFGTVTVLLTCCADCAAYTGAATAISDRNACTASAKCQQAG